ncbi:hypothetical protein GCM10011321_28640 [Youhaiella tibetensis]|nr:hypothetical protein GCM10011321_28640 [Youhaiella tibetensis]
MWGGNKGGGATGAEFKATPTLNPSPQGGGKRWGTIPHATRTQASFSRPHTTAPPDKGRGPAKGSTYDG